MEILHGYRNNEALRASFNALAEQTFGGLNFEGWYHNGFWGDDYDPHSVVLDGKVVANVSVNRTDLVIGGVHRRILQLGTVMTAPEHRNRGYIRQILAYIHREYADVDGIFLFANDSVVNFYPKFGFRRGRETLYRRQAVQSGPCRAQQVPMDGPGQWARLAQAMEANAFREGCPMVGNRSLIFFHVSQFLQQSAWYIREKDAWAIAELEDGELTIHNIFGGADLTVEDVIAAFGEGVRTVSLGFTPADPEGWERQALLEKDCHLFVRGDVFRTFEELQLRIPSLSRA